MGKEMTGSRPSSLDLLLLKFVDESSCIAKESIYVIACAKYRKGTKKGTRAENPLSERANYSSQ